MLIFVYVFSYMGFGIHECSCEGTKDLILMLGDTSCEAIHSHSHPHIHKGCSEAHTHAHIVGHHHGEETACCCDHHCEVGHDDNCCDTNVYIVSSDQDAGKSTLANVVLPAVLLEYPYIIINSKISDLIAESYFDTAPPLSLKVGNSLSTLSVWRL